MNSPSIDFHLIRSVARVKVEEESESEINIHFYSRIGQMALRADSNELEKNLILSHFNGYSVSERESNCKVKMKIAFAH